MSVRAQDVLPATATGHGSIFIDSSSIHDAIDTSKHLRVISSRPTDTAEATALKFNRLARQWRKETSFTSSVEDICTNGAYQEIIGMGDIAIPYILRELETHPANWFWALTAITGANPVSAPFQGTFAEAIQSWLDWARLNGYEW
jgi:hypothetical protein